MPTALPLLLAMLTSATPPPFSVELVPPALFGPLPGSVSLRYVATREIPFLTSRFEWDLMGRRLYFEPDKKWVEVPLRLEGGVLRADGLEREAGGLSRWTLDALEVRYGPYSFNYARSSLEGLPVQEHHPRRNVLAPGEAALSEGTTLLRILPAGSAPAPDVSRLPVNLRGLAEVVLAPGLELEPALRDAFPGQDRGSRLREYPLRQEAVLVEERDLPPADPVPKDPEHALDAAAPQAIRRAELTREQWASLRARPAQRPGLSVSWAFVERQDGERHARLALRAEGTFEPVVLLLTTAFDAQRTVRPAAIRLVPSKKATGSDTTNHTGGTMTDSTRQRWWSDYKAGWELAGTFKKEQEAAMQAWLMQAPQRWSTRAPQIDEDLLRDLELLIQVRAAHRRMALNPGRGDREAPDYADELRGSMVELERYLRVIERLRRLGWEDPWIETGLARDAAWLMEVVKDQADRVELDQGRATDSVRGARALLVRADSSLPGGSR